MPRVKIRWFGHSGFSLQDPSGKIVLVDPWFQGNPTAPSGPEDVRKAEFLLLTHDHFDHAADAATLARQTGALVVGIFELIGDLKAKGVPESQLLHGGIGMTWEHPAHLYLKRAKADQIAFGTPGAHRRRLGELVNLRRADA